MTDEPQVNQHIQANQQLNDTPCMLVFSDKQKDTQRNGQPDVAEVKQIVDKNPRITLWSSRSSAVFRYLRKTEPEFSISKEASILIEEAVSKKYPEIWALFEDL